MSASSIESVRPRTRLLPILLWPCYAIFVLAAIAWGDAHEMQGPTRGLLALGSIVMIALFERFLPLDSSQLLQADRSALHDVGHFITNAFFGAASAAFGVGGGWFLIQHVAPELSAIAIWPSFLPWFAQCVLGVLAADFLGYWLHRAEHTLPALWAYHVVHHKVDRLHVLRGTREHFVTNLIRGALIFAPLVLLGAPIEALFAYQVLAITTGSIAHGNLALELPNGLHRWFLTPPVHRIHHAKSRALSDSNYSTITPIWDRIFGTWTDPVGTPPPEIGAEGESVPDSFLGQLVFPFRRWLGLDKA